MRIDNHDFRKKESENFAQEGRTAIIALTGLENLVFSRGDNGSSIDVGEDVKHKQSVVAATKD
jgi:hypothetical protein